MSAAAMLLLSTLNQVFLQEASAEPDDVEDRLA
jgi:hypothetical protein